MEYSDALCARFLRENPDQHSPWDPAATGGSNYPPVQLERWLFAINQCRKCPLLSACERALAADPGRYHKEVMVVAGRLINAKQRVCFACGEMLPAFDVVDDQCSKCRMQDYLRRKRKARR